MLTGSVSWQTLLPKKEKKRRSVDGENEKKEPPKSQKSPDHPGCETKKASGHSYSRIKIPDPPPLL